jgi:hypothetical protein
MAMMLSYCGLDCSACPAYLAHRDDDQALRERTAPEWSKMYGADLKPADINCVGCAVAQGVHIRHCGVCEYRRCGMSKKLSNCGECQEYPCAKLQEFHKMALGAKQNLDDFRKLR